MKKWLAVTLAVMLLVVLGCQSSATPQASSSSPSGSSSAGKPAASAGAINNDPAAILNYAPMQAMTLDPIKIGAADRYVMNAIYDTLVLLDVNDQPIPGLATSWSSPDPSTFELKLRQGVTFQDGTPFDAEAVKFNIDRARGAESMVKQYLTQVKSVDVVDASTVRLKLDPPLPGSLPAILAGQPGMMASPTAVKAAGSSDAFSQRPVGAGMYKLVGEWQPRGSASVRAWDGYWDKKAQLLGGIDFKAVAPDAELNALRAGDLDMATDLDEGMGTTLQSDSNFRVKISPGTSYRTLIINPTLAPFDNVLVRQAASYAIDREAIAKAMTNGLGQAAWQQFRKGNIAFNPDVLNMYSYDVNKAKALLAQAGHPNGVAFTAVIGRINTSYIRFGELVQAQLKQAGIDMKLDLVDPAQTVPLIWRAGPSGKGTAQASPLAGDADVDPDLMLRAGFLKDSPNNAGGYEPAGFAALVNEAVATVDPQKRGVTYQKVTRIMQEQVLQGVPVYFLNHVTAARSYVGGIERAYPHARYTFRGLYITKGKAPVQ